MSDHSTSFPIEAHDADTVATSGGHGLPEDDVPILGKAEAEDELGRLGDYRVLRLLGEGGMGVVYLAEDVRLRRQVALKVLRPSVARSESTRHRFEREAQAMAALQHENILAVYQVGDENGTPYLAMPLLRGETLAERLKRESPSPLPLPDVFRIGREVCMGLAAAHSRGVIHRDIKPANIWLEADDGRAKVMDFGLARAFQGDSTGSHDGLVIGTPGYMAPEQTRGEETDARTDLFAFGVVLYLMVTGRRPFHRENVQDTLFAITTEPHIPVRKFRPECPAPLVTLIDELLTKEVDLRPPSAEEVLAELEVAEVFVDTAPPTNHLLPPPPRRLRALFVAVGLLLGFVLVALWRLLF